MLRPKSISQALWCPPWLQQNTEPPPCTFWIIVLYACAGGFCSAQLFYSHPILNVLANEFETTQARIANIPTLSLAGDATGLLLILPLADFFPEGNSFFSSSSLQSSYGMSSTVDVLSDVNRIPLCVTKNLQVFEVFSYLAALFGGTTQIMLPLVAETSTDEKRPFNISIVATGPTLGILLARILSGVVANYTSWRNVYFLAFGLQGSILVALWCFMPNYPATNKIPIRKLIATYPNILWTIVMLIRFPVLVQSSLISFCTFFCVSSFWTTLTFLLTGYHYSTTVIGLFGLIGLSTMVLGPLYSRFIIKPLKQPLLSVIVGKTVSIVGVAIGAYTGELTVAGPIIQALFLDAGLMIVQISNRLSIHPVYPEGRNRVNTFFVSVMYLGSLTGTKLGNQVYAYSGWWATGTLSVGILGLSYVLVLMRGPHEECWVGWSGGWGRSSTVQKEPENGQAEHEKEIGDTSVPEGSHRVKAVEP